MELRTTEVKRDNQWVQVDFMEIKNEDTFRLTEPTGELVRAWGTTEFVATSDAFLNEEGIGCVHTEDNYEYADAW